MSFLQILQPQAGQNLITNPSFTLGSTGWTGSNATAAQSTAWQARGAYSLRLTPTASTTGGVYYTTGTLTAATYTFSVYGLFESGIPYQIRFANTSGTTVGTAVTFTGTGSTQYVSVTATVTAAAHRLYVQKNGSASTAVFYIDAAQLELGSVATTYIDGDQDGCTWDGVRDESSSSRNAAFSGGGKWLDWTDDLGLDLIDIQGLGMPPLENVSTPYALLPGAQFQRSIPRSRVITIIGLARGSTWANLHQLRNVLIGRINPDVVSPQQPITLRYTGAGGTVTMQAYYDSGLEIAQTTGFNEQFALRMVAHDPYVYTEDDDGVELGNDTITADYLIRMSSTGTWTSLDSAFANTIDAMVEDVDGTIVVGGSFTNAGGVAAADYIARYNPSTNTWSAIGSAGANGRVRGLYNDAGTIYAVGDFTTIDGVTVNRIAYWDGSAWNDMGTGANASVYAVTVIYNNIGDAIVVAAGNFTSIDGVSANRIAHYDSSAGTWSAIGSGLNGIGRVIVADRASTSGITYYVGGSFTTAAGTTVNRITRYNGTTFTAMGSTGVNNTVNAMLLLDDGLLYVGGAFTTAGGVTAAYIAIWNGASWQSLPTGPAAQVLSLAADTNNGVLVSADGGFTPLDNAGYITNTARWINGAWLPVYNVSDHISSPAMLVTRSGDLYMAGTAAGVSIDYGVPVSVTNTGTAKVSPITDNSVLINWTTGQVFYRMYPTHPSPVRWVDFREGQQRIYDPDTDQSRAWELMPGVTLNMTLVPGVNIISSGSIGGFVYWRRRNLSADGV